MSKKIDDLFFPISSTAESIKILADTDLPQVKEVLYGNKPLLEGCPSRASMAVFVLRRLQGRVEEITELLGDLEKEIWAEYKDKK
jgi:hypothetical protein